MGPIFYRLLSVPIIVIIIMMAIPMVAMMSPHIGAVDPVVMFTPVPRNPDHFVTALPIMGTMGVVWSIADFNGETLRR